MPFSQEQTVSGRADNGTKAFKISGWGSTHSFLNSRILPLGTPTASLLFQVLWGLNTNSTTEFRKVRLSIPASYTQSLHFSPLNLRFEKALLWLGLGKPTLPLPEVLLGCCRAVIQRESTFQTHMGSFIFLSLQQ